MNAILQQKTTSRSFPEKGQSGWTRKIEIDGWKSSTKPRALDNRVQLRLVYFAARKLGPRVSFGDRRPRRSTFVFFHTASVTRRTDGGGERRRFVWGMFLLKHAVTVLFAVLIRQLVICPCLYKGLFDDLGDSRATAGQTHMRARLLVRWKVLGDNILLWLLLVHLFVISAARA